MYIANPIYDVVFKYLMEDSKIDELEDMEREIDTLEEKLVFNRGDSNLFFKK